MDGYPYGTWIVYLRDQYGNWNYISEFYLEENEDYSTHIIQASSTFEPFDAIAVVRLSNESSNHSFDFNTYNFVIEQ